VSPGLVFCEEAAAAKQTSSIETTLDAGQDESDLITRKFTSWNKYEGPLSTLQYGVGALYEYAAYDQDGDSKEQIELEPQAKVRDFRVLLAGRFGTRREVTWKSGLMYDGPTHNWLVRETGVMVAVPEIHSHFFIGRTKEGFSLNKVMVGYTGTSMERSTINDATIPILADGVKWLGFLPKQRILWNVGYYGDALSEGQSFSTYDNQFVTRIAFLPILNDTTKRVLHLGVMGRLGTVNNGKLQVRSRPEAFPAPYFVDSGKIDVSHTKMAGWETYYRTGSLTFGHEYWFQKLDSPSTDNPVFHGGEVMGAWLLTGEVRAYNTVGGFFKRVLPNHPVGKGGMGAVEILLKQSYIDLDSHKVEGGRFWRTTPGVIWYLNDIFRVEGNYGYGTLDRFGVKGGTQFFQCRLQIWI
jgi:phosphate-selective porin OprO/OprP